LTGCHEDKCKTAVANGLRGMHKRLGKGEVGGGGNRCGGSGDLFFMRFKIDKEKM